MSCQFKKIECKVQTDWREKWKKITAWIYIKSKKNVWTVKSQVFILIYVYVDSIKK